MPEDKHTIRIATRGSALALAQARLVMAQCQEAFPELSFELNIIKTTGDKALGASLANPELPKGLFTKELEVALLKGEADLAVHSLKDLPTDLPAGLKLGAVSSREDVRDVLIYHTDALGPLTTLSDLPDGTVVATSSTRRSAQLLEHRPGLKVIPIRGNVGTRLRKVVEQPDLSATILAAAGLSRLGIHIQPDGQLTGEGVPAGLRAIRLEPEEMLPCVGQAALGLEVRERDERITPLCDKLNDPDTFSCVTAERAFLQAMGGGCHLAVAAYGQIQSGQLYVRAVSFLQGAPRRGEGNSSPEAASELGQRLARELLAGPAS